MEFTKRLGCGYFHATCVLCGEWMDTGGLELELHDGSERLGIVCPRCIRAGDAGAAERVKAHAERLRARAEALDEIAEELAQDCGLIPADFFEYEAAVEERMELEWAEERDQNPPCEVKGGPFDDIPF